MPSKKGIPDMFKRKSKDSKKVSLAKHRYDIDPMIESTPPPAQSASAAVEMPAIAAATADRDEHNAGQTGAVPAARTTSRRSKSASVVSSSSQPYAGGESTVRRKTADASASASQEQPSYKPGGAYMPPEPVKSLDSLDDLLAATDKNSPHGDKYRTPNHSESLSNDAAESPDKFKTSVTQAYSRESSRKSPATSPSRRSTSERSSSTKHHRTIKPPSLRQQRTSAPPPPPPASSFDASTHADEGTYTSFESSAVGYTSTGVSSYTRRERPMPPTRTRRSRRDRHYERDIASVGSSTFDSEQNYSYAPSVTMWSATDDSLYYDPNKQRIGWWCIFAMAAQFMVLLTQMLMCGVATLDKNVLLGPFPDAFSEWGGKNAYLILDEMQYYRFFSALFLNVGVVHLIINAYCMLETAYRYEREWGSFRFVLIYILSGASCVGTGCAFDPETIAVCSSGPLLGIFGAKFAQVLSWTCFEMDEKTGNLEDVRLDQLGNLTCSMAMLLVLSFLTYVDFSGNMGALGVGFLSGMFLFCRPIDNLCVRFMWGVLLGLFVLLGYGVGIAYLLIFIVETDEDLGDACNYFSNIFPEGYDCDCVWN